MGLVAEVGVVETQAVAAATLGPPRGERAAAARFVDAGRLAAERGGGAAGNPEGRPRALETAAAAAGASSGV